MAEPQSFELEKLTARVTWKWKKTLTNYPASEWTLTYYLRTDGETATRFSATADGDTHLVTVAAAITAGYAAGVYADFLRNHDEIAGFRLNPSTWSRGPRPLSCVQGRASSAQSRVSGAHSRVSSAQGRASGAQGHASGAQGNVSGAQDPWEQCS